MQQIPKHFGTYADACEQALIQIEFPLQEDHLLEFFHQQNGGPDAYITMMQDLDKIPVGSDGLITLPYFALVRVHLGKLYFYNI